MEEFFYTYVLLCSDGKHYIGSTANIVERFKEHKYGHVKTTACRLPVKLVYYEACQSKEKAQAREKYFKTGFGRKFLKDRL